MQQQDLTSLAETLVALDEQSAVSVICSVLESRPDLAPSVVTFSVPDLTYPPIKALTERRSEGIIKCFNEQKGYGFITCEELQKVFGNDVFVNSFQFRGCQVGEQVSFAVALNKENKPQAYDLRPASQHPPHQVAQMTNGAKGNSKGAWSMVPAQPAQNQSSKWGAQDWGAQEWGAQDKWGAQDWNAQEAWTSKGSGWQQGQQGQGQAQQWGAGANAKRKTYTQEQVIGDYQGYIKSFNQTNGYGFIACEALKQEGYTHDVFMPAAQFLESGLQVGSEVEFTCFLNGKGQPQGAELRQPSKRAKTW